jgi:hypothetical protein
MLSRLDIIDSLLPVHYHQYDSLFKSNGLAAWYSRKHETSLGFHTSIPMIIVTEHMKGPVATLEQG